MERHLKRLKPQNKTIMEMLIAFPGITFFLIFFIIPLLSLFLVSLDKPTAGVVSFQWMFTFENFEKFFSKSIYYESAIRSTEIAIIVSVISLLLSYPFAFVIARHQNQKRSQLLTTMVLCAMQLDMVIRLFGLMVLMGDRGILNEALRWIGLIGDKSIPLMYNNFGVIIGLVQFSLPFMILSLIGSIQNINRSLEEASRSLGANHWQCFWKITVPLSMPGILSGLLLVFAISFSSYVVPTLMGGWKVVVLPIHVYQQIAELGKWQFGSTVAVAMFTVSFIAMVIYQRAAHLVAGGRI
mgnify:CR=1 FL=1